MAAGFRSRFPRSASRSMPADCVAAALTLWRRLNMLACSCPHRFENPRARYLGILRDPIRPKTRTTPSPPGHSPAAAATVCTASETAQSPESKTSSTPPSAAAPPASETAHPRCRNPARTAKPIGASPTATVHGNFDARHRAPPRVLPATLARSFHHRGNSSIETRVRRNFKTRTRHRRLIVVR